VRISAKADYAVRAAIELAAAGTERPTKGDAVAQAQGIPLKFLENILADMRHAGLVTSRRGAEGGYWLARPAEEITVADIIRAVEGPLASVRGGRPEDVDYAGSAEPAEGLDRRARRAALRRRAGHARRPRGQQAAQGRRGPREGPGGVGDAPVNGGRRPAAVDAVTPVTRR
jgi:Rrf2 family protein